MTIIARTARSISILLLLSIALLGHSLGAEDPGWQLLGPEGAAVRELEQDPSSSDTFYAATWGDLYRSTDGGNTWTPLDLERPVVSIEIDPTDSSKLYAGTDRGELATSLDGGVTWSFRTDPDPFGLNAPAIVLLDPTTPSTLYVGFVESSAFPGTTPGVLKSTDGGASWEGVDDGIESFPIFSMAMDPQNPAVLYLGTRGAVLQTTDGAASWSVLGAGELPSNREVLSLAVDPADSDRIYAGLDIEGIYRSDDGGLTWNEKTTGLSGFEVRDFAFDPTDSSIVYSADSLGVFRSSDRGEMWTAANDGLFALTMATVLVDPTDADHLLTGGFLGVFRSTDGAQSWIPTNTGLAHRSVFRLLADPVTPSTVYASSVSDTLHRSPDAGATWPVLLLDGANAQAPTAMTYAPSAPSTLYTGCDFGVLFRSTDGGGTWTELPIFVDGDRQFATVTSLAVHPQDPMNLYAGLDTGFPLIHSEDAGLTWSPSNQGLDFGDVHAVVIDPRYPSILYAAQRRMFRSIDGGSSWSPASEGLPSFPLEVRDLDMDSGEPPTLFLSVGNGGVFRSTDRAETWQPINDGLPVSSVNTLLIDPDQAEILYAAPSVNGVFRSTDRGTTWSPLNDGFPVASLSITQAPDVKALTLGSSAPERTLYAGAFSTLAPSGVYGLPLPFPSLFIDGFESGDVSAWSSSVSSP